MLEDLTPNNLVRLMTDASVELLNKLMHSTIINVKIIKPTKIVAATGYENQPFDMRLQGHYTKIDIGCAHLVVKILIKTAAVSALPQVHSSQRAEVDRL